MTYFAGGGLTEGTEGWRGQRMAASFKATGRSPGDVADSVISPASWAL